jgi:hypothetical protein
MSTKDNYSKTLRFSVETDEKLSKLAQKFGLSKFQFFNRMVDYFYRTKKDPSDIADELLKSTLAKNHDTYIRFIRAQEDRVLIPVKTEVDRMVQSQLRIIEFFNVQVLKANKDLLAGQQTQEQTITALFKTITEKLDTKESLKLKFLYILDHYSKTAFAATPKEREILLQETKQHISKL